MAQCKAKSKRSGEQCKKHAVNGKGVCHIHGGKTPSGIASPHFKNGRYSKVIPRNLAQLYTEALDDPDPLSLTDDVRLLRTLAAKHLKTMNAGDGHPAWIEAHKACKALADSIRFGTDASKLLDNLAALENVIKPHYRATKAEGKVVDLINRVGNTADKERRLLIDRQRVVAIEYVMATITAIIMGIKESVTTHCDNQTARLILADTNTAYCNAVNGAASSEVIDAG